MKQVVREAGVAQGLIHYYLSGKDEILLEVLMDAFRGVRPRDIAAPGPLLARGRELPQRRGYQHAAQDHLEPMVRMARITLGV